MSSKHPDTAALARKAFEASECKTHREFIALFGEDVIGLRTFRGWLAGDYALPSITRMLLEAFIAGWRPACPPLK